jgi:hypothetical protein
MKIVAILLIAIYAVSAGAVEPNERIPVVVCHQGFLYLVWPDLKVKVSNLRCEKSNEA